MSTKLKSVVSLDVYKRQIGYCEAFLNGEKIGDRLLDPGWTDYRRRVLYRDLYKRQPWWPTASPGSASGAGT